MSPRLPLISVHAHTRALGRRWCDKPDKKLEKNSDPPIINPIIRERIKFSNFCRKIQTQMCPQLPLVGMHIHTHPQGSPWCDKPDKKLEKNLDPPIINPIIREGKKAL